MADNLYEQITEIEREIAKLPEGGIAKKTIKGKDYYYHRITRDGKRVENYVSFEDVKNLKAGIDKRKKLEKELKELNRLIPKDKSPAIRDQSFVTKVRTAKELEAQIAPVRRYKKRECISTLRDYVFGPGKDKVLIIYGLRRTGKTTMIRQILTELPQAEFGKAAFIQVTSGDTLADVDSDLRKLEKSGYRYIFIDEVTLMEDFVEGAALPW